METTHSGYSHMPADLQELREAIAAVSQRERKTLWPYESAAEGLGDGVDAVRDTGISKGPFTVAER